MHNAPRSSGFTLIEVMIVVAVIGILAAIAYPSFAQFFIRSDRSDAHAALMQVQLAQERRRSTNSDYSNDLAGLNTSLISQNGGFYSEKQLYLITLSDVSRGGYTVTATAQGKQANDRTVECRSIALRMTRGGEQRGYISGTFQQSPDCW